MVILNKPLDTPSAKPVTELQWMTFPECVRFQKEMALFASVIRSLPVDMSLLASVIRALPVDMPLLASVSVFSMYFNSEIAAVLI